MSMSEEDVEFLDEATQEAPRMSFKKAVYSPTIKWLVKKGWAQNEAEANTVMITVIILVFSLSLLFTYIGIQYSKNEDGDVLPSPGNGYTVTSK